MRIIHPGRGRRGAVLPLVTFCLVALLGLVALAIDIGLIAIARSQCQNAADSGALAGTRTISGDSSKNYNYDLIASAAIQAAVDNKIMGTAFSADPSTNWNPSDPVLKAQVHPNDYTFVTGQLKVEVGSYSYTYDDSNPGKEGFQLYFPRKDDTEPYGAVRMTASYNGNYNFAGVFGLSGYETGATAIAVHRPRDVVIIMDLSGSMRFQSLPGGPYYGNRTFSLNPESVIPKFGHYSDTAGAALYGNTAIASGSGEYYDPANISVKTDAGPTILDYFFQNGASESPDLKKNGAFARAADDYSTAPGGDNFLKKTQDTAADYAATVSEVVLTPTGDSSFETNGYDAYRSGTNTFKGYTQGPGYWGKTFWIWPPDPRGATKSASDSANYADNGAKDWRQRFFLKVNGSNLDWLDQNTVLFDSSGNPRSPGSSVSVNTSTIDGAGTPTMQQTSYTYRPNYAAIFKWLDTDPKPFPSVLRAGRIKYYDALPDYNDSTLNSRLWSNTASNLTNLNERFWKGYVDFVLCLDETGANSWSSSYTQIGNGAPYTWGSVQVSDKPTLYQYGKINNTGGYSAGYDTTGTNYLNLDTLNDYNGGNPTNPTSAADNSTDYDYIVIQGHASPYPLRKDSNYSSSGRTVRLYLTRPLDAAVGNNAYVYFYSFPANQKYMRYDDNPRRPKHHFWFGPMTMYDYLGNYNQNRFWLPGAIPEAQAWSCKVGIQTAIDDIKNNHPNDYLGLTFFSSPKYSRTGSGQHNRAVVPLGREYQKLKDSLWFPPSTVTGSATEITPWDDDFDNVPRAKGGTAPGMGFMIAYNLLSSSTKNLRTYTQPQPQYRGLAGGLGRKGAARIVIFETDGAPNTYANTTIQNQGADSYYPIRVKNSVNLSDTNNTEWPSSGSYSNTEVYNVVKQIAALETASPPGYSTNRKQAQVYCIGYGTLFDPKNSSDPDQSTAIQFFQYVQYYGNTSTTTKAGAFPSNQLIYGTQTERVTRMQAAFQSIMQGGVQVALQQ